MDSAEHAGGRVARFEKSGATPGTPPECAPQHPGKLHRLVRSRRVIAGLFFINGFGVASWVIQIPRVKEKLHLTDQELGWALLATGLGALCTMSIAGWLMSRFSSRVTTVIAGSIYSISLVGPALADNFGWFVTALFAMGALNGVMDVSMNNQAAHCEKDLGRPIMSSFHALWSAGGWLGSLIGGLFLLDRAWTEWHLPIIAVLMLLSIPLLYPGLLPQPVNRSAGGLLSVPRGALLRLGLLCFLAMLAEGAVADWAGILLKDTHRVGPGTSALGFTAFSLSMAVGRLTGDRIVQHLGRGWTVRLGALLAAAGLFLAATAPVWWISVAGFGVSGFGIANVVPVLFSLSAVFGSDNIERAGSSVFATGYLGFLIGPATIGTLAQRTGLPASLAILAFSLLILCFNVRDQPMRPASAE